MYGRERAFGALFTLVALSLLCNVSAQISLSLSAPAELALGSAKAAEITQTIENVVAIRYKGNQDAYERPFTGSLVSLEYFKEITKIGLGTFRTYVVLLDEGNIPPIPAIRAVSSSGAGAVIIGSYTDSLPGRARFDTDGTGMRDIEIPVFQIDSEATRKLNSYFFVAPESGICNGNMSVSINGKVNPYETYMLSTGTFVMQGALFLSYLIEAVAIAVVLQRKIKKSPGSINPTISCLFLMILSWIAKCVCSIDPLGRLDFYPLWWSTSSIALFLPFTGTALFVLITYWSEKMSRKGIRPASSFAKRAPYVMGPLLMTLILLLILSFYIYRDRLNSSTIYAIFLVVAALCFISTSMFLGYVVYTAILTYQYITENSAPDGAQLYLRRIRFTLHLLIAISIDCAIIMSFIAYVAFTIEPYFRFYAHCLVFFFLNVGDGLALLIFHGRIPFTSDSERYEVRSFAVSRSKSNSRDRKSDAMTEIESRGLPQGPSDIPATENVTPYDPY